MNDKLREVLGRFQANLLLILAVVFVVLLLVAYGWVYSTSISPALLVRNELTTQVLAAQKALDNRVVQSEDPAVMRSRVDSARATLTASYDLFLKDAQAVQAINALYQAASESGVMLIDFQTQLPSKLLVPTVAIPNPPAAAPAVTQTVPALPTATPNIPTGQNSLYNVTSVSLRVMGSAPRLMDFVARIREAAAPSFVINSLDLVGGDKSTTATLSMDISLYTSPFATGAAGEIRPATPSEIAMPTATLPLPTLISGPPTITPVPRYISYVVQLGDTLPSIAQRYGTTVEVLVAVNHLDNGAILVGQQLLVPVP